MLSDELLSRHDLPSDNTRPYVQVSDIRKDDSAGKIREGEPVEQGHIRRRVIGSDFPSVCIRSRATRSRVLVLTHIQLGA